MSNRTRGVRSKVYLDILRIIAIFLVIFNHAPGYNKAIGYYDGENIKNIIFYMIGTFTKINVPLFLMVSGALLLGKEENWDAILKKRILRMFIVLLLAHLIIYIENICVVGIEKGSLFTLVGVFFSQVFANSMEGTIAYWYLYAYISFLFILPFLRRISRGFIQTDFYVLMVLKICISTLVPIFDFIASLMGNSLELSVQLNIVLVVSDIIFYPLMGFYLDNIVDIKSISRTKWIASIIVMGVTWVVACACSLYAHDGDVIALKYNNCVVWMMALFFFALVKRLYVAIQDRIGDKAKKVVARYGTATFGVYLLEPMVGRNLFTLFEKATDKWLSSMSVSLIWGVLLIVIGGEFILALKKYTILGRIL